MGFFAHAQTVDTRPLFPPPMWPGYEATSVLQILDVVVDGVVDMVGGEEVEGEGGEEGGEEDSEVGMEEEEGSRVHEVVVVV